MSYNVYLASYIGAPRNHQAIFVETEPDNSGRVFQVKGDIQNGMTYESKPAKRPDDSATFVEKVFIGTVSEANFSRIHSICDGITPPAKQFDLAKRLNPQVPLRRCQEWTNEAVQALKTEGVLE